MIAAILSLVGVFFFSYFIVSTAYRVIDLADRVELLIERLGSLREENRQLKGKIDALQREITGGSEKENPFS